MTYRNFYLKKVFIFGLKLLSPVHHMTKRGRIVLNPSVFIYRTHKTSFCGKVIWRPMMEIFPRPRLRVSFPSNRSLLFSNTTSDTSLSLQLYQRLGPIQVMKSITVVFTPVLVSPLVLAFSSEVVLSSRRRDCSRLQEVQEREQVNKKVNSVVQQFAVTQRSRMLSFCWMKNINF